MEISPLALENFLEEHKEVKRIYLCLDNDKAGRDATECYGRALEGKYEVHYAFPKRGKDYNEMLQMVVGRRSKGRVYDR